MITRPTKARFPPILVMAVGVLAISFSAIFIRLAQNEESVPSLAIATWRTLIASLILLPLAVARRRQELMSLKTADWLLAIFSGIMLGAHFGSWITSLAYTSIASSTVLVTTSPLWVGLASPLVLHEPLSRALKIGLALALTGSVIIGLGDMMVWENGRWAFELAAAANANQNVLWGNGLALMGAITAAVYLLIGRRLRQQLSLLSYTTVVYGVSALTLLVTTLLRGVPLLGYTPTAYLLFLLMALFPQLLGHSSYNWALGFLPAAFVSVAVISEPIGAGLLGILFFGEIPGPITILGSVFILVGIVKAGRG